MTWLAPKLKDRVEIQKAIQTPNAEGGYDRTYQTLLTIWAGFLPINKPDSLSAVGSSNYTRGSQTNTASTHKFIIRRIAVRTLGVEFSPAFNEDFDTVFDFSSLKSEWFIFIKKASSVKGRLFRINSLMNVNETDEYFILRTEEIEEKGTGYPS
jgi:hypothetical protein